MRENQEAAGMGPAAGTKRKLGAAGRSPEEQQQAEGQGEVTCRLMGVAFFASALMGIVPVHHLLRMLPPHGSGSGCAEYAQQQHDEQAEHAERPRKQRRIAGAAMPAAAAAEYQAPTEGPASAVAEGQVLVQGAGATGCTPLAVLPAEGVKGSFAREAAGQLAPGQQLQQHETEGQKCSMEVDPTPISEPCPISQQKRTSEQKGEQGSPADAALATPAPDDGPSAAADAPQPPHIPLSAQKPLSRSQLRQQLQLKRCTAGLPAEAPEASSAAAKLGAAGAPVGAVGCGGMSARGSGRTSRGNRLLGLVKQQKHAPQAVLAARQGLEQEQKRPALPSPAQDSTQQLGASEHQGAGAAQPAAPTNQNPEEQRGGEDAAGASDMPKDGKGEARQQQPARQASGSQRRLTASPYRFASSGMSSLGDSGYANGPDHDHHQRRQQQQQQQQQEEGQERQKAEQEREQCGMVAKQAKRARDTPPTPALAELPSQPAGFAPAVPQEQGGPDGSSSSGGCARGPVAAAAASLTTAAAAAAAAAVAAAPTAEPAPGNVPVRAQAQAGKSLPGDSQLCPSLKPSPQQGCSSLNPVVAMSVRQQLVEELGFRPLSTSKHRRSLAATLEGCTAADIAHPAGTEQTESAACIAAPEGALEACGSTGGGGALLSLPGISPSTQPEQQQQQQHSPQELPSLAPSPADQHALPAAPAVPAVALLKPSGLPSSSPKDPFPGFWVSTGSQGPAGPAAAPGAGVADSGTPDLSGLLGKQAQREGSPDAGGRRERKVRFVGLPAEPVEEGEGEGQAVGGSSTSQPLRAGATGRPGTPAKPGLGKMRVPAPPVYSRFGSTAFRRYNGPTGRRAALLSFVSAPDGSTCMALPPMPPPPPSPLGAGGSATHGRAPFSEGLMDPSEVAALVGAAEEEEAATAAAGGAAGGASPAVLSIPRRLQALPQANPRRLNLAGAAAQKECPLQDLREAFLNARLAGSWARGEGWARLDLAGVELVGAKAPEYQDRLQQLCTALGEREGQEAADRALVQLEGEWQHLQRLRQRYSAATPEPEAGPAEDAAAGGPAASSPRQAAKPPPRSILKQPSPLGRAGPCPRSPSNSPVHGSMPALGEVAQQAQPAGQAQHAQQAGQGAEMPAACAAAAGTPPASSTQPLLDPGQGVELGAGHGQQAEGPAAGVRVQGLVQGSEEEAPLQLTPDSNHAGCMEEPAQEEPLQLTPDAAVELTPVPAPSRGFKMLLSAGKGAPAGAAATALTAASPAAGAARAALLFAAPRPGSAGGRAGGAAAAVAARQRPSRGMRLLQALQGGGPPPKGPPAAAASASCAAQQGSAAPYGAVSQEGEMGPADEARGERAEGLPGPAVVVDMVLG